MAAPGLKEALALVSRGVPYEVAMRMSLQRRLAFNVIFGELDGRDFDWRALRWVSRE